MNIYFYTHVFELYFLIPGASQHEVPRRSPVQEGPGLRRPA